MWLFLNDAFVSIVQSSVEPDKFSVRARNANDLELLFPDEPIYENMGEDYAARCFINKEKVIRVVLERMSNINYTNFKDTIDANDELRQDAYVGVWQDMLLYQLKLHPSKTSRLLDMYR